MPEDQEERMVLRPNWKGSLQPQMYVLANNSNIILVSLNLFPSNNAFVGIFPCCRKHKIMMLKNFHYSIDRQFLHKPSHGLL